MYKVFVYNKNQTVVCFQTDRAESESMIPSRTEHRNLDESTDQFCTSLARTIAIKKTALHSTAFVFVEFASKLGRICKFAAFLKLIASN
jgi:hypothetical protein